MKNLLFTIISLFLTINAFSQCENDSINPYFINFEPEVTISCDVDLSVVFPLVIDECDDSVEVAWYEETTNIYCDNSYDLFRVYRAFDDFGNQSVESQVIHVVDETSPLFQPSSTIIISCEETPVFGQPIVTDNCGFITITNQDIVDTTDNCQTIYTRVWTAYDQCGNTSYSSQTIIAMDTIPPVITGPIYFEINEGDNIDTSFITVTDNCSTFTLNYIDSEVSGHSIIRNYTATDACGNESTFEQIIHMNHDEDEDEGGGGNNRVAICHNLGNGDWITIYVAEPAVPAHLAHGDYLGPCTEMMIDWQQILPNSDLQMRVIKGKDNKYKKFVRVN
jgi:hypothetical protein